METTNSLRYNSKGNYSLSFYLLLALFGLVLADEEFFRYQTVFSLGTNWRVMDVSLLFVLATLSMVSLGRRKNEMSVRGSRSVFLLLILYVLLGVIAVARGYLAVGTWAIGIGRYSLLDILILPIMLVVIDSDRKLRALIKFIAWIIIPIWVAYFLLGLGTLNVQLEWVGEHRFVDDAYTAFVLACSTVLLTPFVLDKNGGLRVSWTIVILSFFMIMFTQQRSVWVATAGGIAMIFYLAFKGKMGSKLLFSLMTLAVMLSLLLIILNNSTQGKFLPNIISNRLAFLQDPNEDPTGRWRLWGWNQVIQEVEDHQPLLGFGFGQLGWVEANGDVTEVWEHNQYIHFLRASGFIGLAAFVVFLGAVTRFVLKTVPRLESEFHRRAMIAGASAFVMNLVFMFFYNESIFLWISVGIIFVTARLGFRSQSRSSPAS